MDDELAAENTQKGGKAFEPPADQVPDSITPKRSNGQPDSPARMAPSAAASGSDTEDDDDEIVLSTPSKARPQAYAESSLDIAQVDEHTGLVTNSAAFSREDPIGDFEKKLASPESSVESIIDSMGELITKTVTSSFGSNDYTHARDLLIAMRKGSTEVSCGPRRRPFFVFFACSSTAYTFLHVSLFLRSTRKPRDTMRICVASRRERSKEWVVRPRNEHAQISGTTLSVVARTSVSSLMASQLKGQRA